MDQYEFATTIIKRRARRRPLCLAPFPDVFRLLRLIVRVVCNRLALVPPVRFEDELTPYTGKISATQDMQRRFCFNPLERYNISIT